MTKYPQIVIIACLARDGAIGRRGDLVFHISADLKHFKSLTIGHPTIMGRKTFESLPGGALPGRRNIVVTRNAAYTATGIETAQSLDEALNICSDCDICYVIGGGELYAAALPIASKLELTIVESPGIAADTFFPVIGNEWKEAESSPLMTDERSGLQYRFVTLCRTT